MAKRKLVYFGGRKLSRRGSTPNYVITVPKYWAEHYRLNFGDFAYWYIDTESGDLVLRPHKLPSDPEGSYIQHEEGLLS